MPDGCAGICRGLYRRPVSAVRLAAHVVAFLLGHRALGRRQRLEARVRDRLATLDRASVATVGETLLGPLDGGELAAQVRGELGVELCPRELSGLVARALAGSAVVGSEGPHLVLDALA